MNFVLHPDEEGSITILDWWKDHYGSQCQYSSSAMAYASSLGRVKVLDWWKNSGFVWDEAPSNAISSASVNGHINVLEWWRENLSNDVWKKTLTIPAAWARQGDQAETLEYWRELVRKGHLRAEEAGLNDRSH